MTACKQLRIAIGCAVGLSLELFGNGHTVAASDCRARTNQPCVTVRIAPLPVDLPAALRAVARRFLLSNPDTPTQQHADVHTLTASWRQAWRKVYQTPAQLRYGLGSPWSLERRAKYLEIKSARPWSCLHLAERVYAGGNHSQQRLESHLLDMQTGKKIVWQELLADNVTAAAFTEFVTTIVDNTYPQRWKNEPLRLQHIVPDELGISFWWNPYELGHYSIDRRGAPRVLVNWEKLKMWLDPKRIPQKSKYN